MRSPHHLQDEPWVVIERLCKDYKKLNWLQKAFKKHAKTEKIVRAVDSVDFNIKRGEVVGYLGPNGAGKSTTIKMIAGILKPTSGTIKVGGRDPFIDAHKHKMELGIAFGQRSKLLWDLPVEESMLYHAVLYKIDSRIRKRRISDIADTFDIQGLLRKPVRQLSLGQRMRCELALTFLHSPKLILLDEPTIGLDFNSRDIIHRVIKRAVSEYGATILLSSHDLKDVESVCSRIVLLNKGSVLFDGSLEALSCRSSAVSIINVGFLGEYSPAQIKKQLEEIQGVVSVIVGHGQSTITYRGERSFNDIIATISTCHTILSLQRQEPDLEDLIRTYYQKVAL